MTNDAFRQQTHAYFLMEAQDLLQAIEQDLLSLREDRQLAKVHNLMRAAHTLKGAAASVGFQSVKTMAHNLEDVFKAFYNPEVIIDAELENLLLASYDYLRSPITAAVAEITCNDADVLSRAHAVFEQIKAKLGQHFNPNAGIPTSAELGFDITRSIFETGVSERLEALATAIADDAESLTQTLQVHAEVFGGLAESLNLPGFGAIAQAVQVALAVHPEQSLAIATAALIDFRQGQAAVLTGDRTQGGKPSAALQQLTQKSHPVAKKSGAQKSAQRSVTALEVPAPPAPLKPAAASSRVKSQSIAVPQSLAQGNRWVEFWDWMVDFLNQPLWSTQRQPVNPHQFPFDLPIVDSAIAGQMGDRYESMPGNDAPQLAINLPAIAARVGIQIPDDCVIEFDAAAVRRSEGQPDDVIDFDDLSAQSFSGKADDDFSFELTELAQGLAELEKFAPADGFVGPWEEELLPAPTVEVPLPTRQDLAALTDHWQAAPVSSPHSPASQPAPPRSEPLMPNEPTESVNGAPTKLRVNLVHLEALNYSISELLINQNRQDLQSEQITGFVKELTDRLRRHQQTMMYLREWSDRWLMADAHPLPAQNSIANFDALELDQHSEMHGLLQDALEQIVKLSQTTESLDLTVRQSEQTLSHQSRLLMNARDDLMEARMVPIGSVLNRLPRLLQQLVEAHGKQVELQLKGTQILVDKVIADKLYDPLLHLIRNAFDHGIEPSESRLQQGKPAIGKIAIRAYQQGNRTLIDIGDDGYGLDFPRICRRAYEGGLLPTDQVDHFTKAELINILFEPGFSTAAQVSDLSGRGVGLDVVKAQVQALKGIVTVQSEPTQGTTFSLQLPLTLMTARLLVCQVGTTIYGFLSDEVERVLLPQSQQIEVATGQTIFHWQQADTDCPVPVHDLSDLVSYGLPLPPIADYELATPVLNSHTQPLLLLRVTDGLLGIRVDQVVGEQELVIRPISAAITPPAYIYGCSILADGRLMLVIDGAALVRQQGQVHPKTPPLIESGSSGSRPTPPAKQVLIIDDSITIRQTLTETLKNAGYEVIQAQDGLDAIAQLQQHPQIQLITCDIEMPRLNGFEFLRRYRQDASLPQLPVVMLTSRTSEKHRQLALQLGATAYMTKPYINQEFVRAIEPLFSAKSVSHPISTGGRSPL